MSSINQITTQPQQPARGRIGNAQQQNHTIAQRTSNLLTTSQAVMHHHVEGLVVSYLEQYPDLFAGLLQRHEEFLAHYVRAHYNIALPTRYGLKCAAPSRQPDTIIANLHSEAPPPASMPIPRTSNYERPSVQNGDSPQSTSSQLSNTWPSEEDLNVPYPAPKKYLDREIGLLKGKGYKWSFEEQDLAIECMFLVRDDPKVPKTEKRFEAVSRIFMEQYGIERSKDSVKNMWNRIGRQRSKFDERKNKSAPLATSQQGKQARIEHEAKRNGKRKASAEPEQPVQKKSKASSVVDEMASDAYSWKSMSSQEMAKSNISLDPSLDPSFDPLLDPSLDDLFSDQEDGALPQYGDMNGLLSNSQTQPGRSGSQGIPPATASTALPEVAPATAVSQTQPPASGTQDALPTTASPVYQDYPTFTTQREAGPQPGAEDDFEEELRQILMAALGEDENGYTDAYHFNMY